MLVKAVSTFNPAVIRCNADKTLMSVTDIISHLTDASISSVRKYICKKLKNNPCMAHLQTPIKFVSNCPVEICGTSRGVARCLREWPNRNIQVIVMKLNKGYRPNEISAFNAFCGILAADSINTGCVIL